MTLNYIVRNGSEYYVDQFRRLGRGALVAQWGQRAYAARCTRDAATQLAKRFGGKVVRLLTPAESRRKAAAEALRAVAANHRSAAAVADAQHCFDGMTMASWHEFYARKRDIEADALWPRKGAGRG